MCGGKVKVDFIQGPVWITWYGYFKVCASSFGAYKSYGGTGWLPNSAYGACESCGECGACGCVGWVHNSITTTAVAAYLLDSPRVYHWTNGVLYKLMGYSSMEPLHSRDLSHSLEWIPFFWAALGAIVPKKVVVSDSNPIQRIEKIWLPKTGATYDPYQREIGCTYEGRRYPRKYQTKT